MATSNNYKIDPLNEENYVTWWRCLEWILDDLDLWAITNGMELELQSIDPWAVTQAERMVLNEWKKKDKKVKREICLRISDEYLFYIDQITTTPELWAKLQAIFENKAAVGIVNIRWEFFWTFAEDGVNMEEHVCKLHRLYQQLNARGQLVTDEDFANTLLTSLPETWSSFITTINDHLGDPDRQDLGWRSVLKSWHSVANSIKGTRCWIIRWKTCQNRSEMDKRCCGVAGWRVHSDGRRILFAQHHRLLEIGVTSDKVMGQEGDME